MINRCFVRGKPCSAKATEAEVAQRAMPPRATPAQLGFPLTRRAQAERRGILKTAPNGSFPVFAPTQNSEEPFGSGYLSQSVGHRIIASSISSTHQVHCERRCEHRHFLAV